MKTLIATTAAAALMALTAPAFAYGTDAAIVTAAKVPTSVQQPHEDFAKRGRNRGGRSKPRVPGGSGCDDPEDILEHPECRG